MPRARLDVDGAAGRIPHEQIALARGFEDQLGGGDLD
jgi:hypothetical protein